MNSINFGFTHEPFAEIAAAGAVRQGQTGFECELLKREHYMESYLGVDFDAPTTGPLDLVTMHPHEDTWSKSLYMVRLNEFFAYRVHQETGFTFDEFLRQPRAIVVDIIARLERKAQTDEQHATNLLREHERSEREVRARAQPRTNVPERYDQ